MDVEAGGVERHGFPDVLERLVVPAERREQKAVAVEGLHLPGAQLEGAQERAFRAPPVELVVEQDGGQGEVGLGHALLELEGSERGSFGTRHGPREGSVAGQTQMRLGEGRVAGREAGGLGEAVLERLRRPEVTRPSATPALVAARDEVPTLDVGLARLERQRRRDGRARERRAETERRADVRGDLGVAPGQALVGVVEGTRHRCRRSSARHSRSVRRTAPPSRATVPQSR